MIFQNRKVGVPTFLVLMDMYLSVSNRQKRSCISHITESQRYTIGSMQKQGYNKSEIARVIGKHKSVVYYEIRPNSDKRSGVYNDELANKKYAKRLKEKPKYKRFILELKNVIEALLRQDI